MRRAAALQVRFVRLMGESAADLDMQVNITGAMGLANVVKGNLGM